MHALSRIQTRLSCQHPEEAAYALGDNSRQQEWDASIEQMEQSATHICAALVQGAALPIRMETRSRLFKVTDIPPFADTKEYENYRNAIAQFLPAHDDPLPSEFRNGLKSILQAFTASATWNVNNLIRPT